MKYREIYFYFYLYIVYSTVVVPVFFLPFYPPRPAHPSRPQSLPPRCPRPHVTHTCSLTRSPFPFLPPFPRPTSPPTAISLFLEKLLFKNTLLAVTLLKAVPSFLLCGMFCLSQLEPFIRPTVPGNSEFVLHLYDGLFIKMGDSAHLVSS